MVNYSRVTPTRSSGDGAAYIQVWLYKQEVAILSIVLQPKETCDAIWASKEQIQQMISDGNFINFSYIDELFEHVSKSIN